MTVQLSETAQRFVDEELARGPCSSAAEVIEVALRDLVAKREREETIQAVREGVADADAGRMYTVEEAFEIVRRENPYLSAD